MDYNKFIGIIPARYASTRFPGKPLQLIGGKSMIQRVFEQVSKVLPTVYVATDDQRIFDAVEAFGGNVVMTSENHKSGTDRCFEAFQKVGAGKEIVINIQGDEPFIQISQIETICQCFDNKETQIATLVKPFKSSDGTKALFNPNSPKVLLNKDSEAIYFSRNVIPYLRGKEQEDWINLHTYYKHIGLYAYRGDVLKEITQLPQSSLELAESLEQLRWIENGYKIKVGVTEVETIGIDTPEDLKAAEAFLQKNFK
ncbi:MAG: 3-deoxy-manno-octulosonate cytidylyltransferase [Paludibacteraceae bacterium]|nr:3-deoxy-manno-octulosonate cytidylyltransferase [Paludibacteraceae bacterium]